MKKNIFMIAYTTYSGDPRIRREAETLASFNGNSVYIVVPKEGLSRKKYRMDGVNVIEANVRQYQGKSKLKYIISYLRFMILSFISCSWCLFGGKIDIVHVHNMPNFLVYVAILPRLFGKKLILDIHDSVPETYAGKFENRSGKLFKLLCLEEKISCRFVNKIICVNHVQRDVLTNRGILSSKIEVSLNVPDHKRFILKENSKDTKIALGNFKLVYHGTITKRLGVDLAIQAVAKLMCKIQGLEFHIYGIGDDVVEFKELSKNLKVDHAVFINRGVPIESIVSILDGMDLGIIANRKNIATELMLPVKMLEYIALNIPVIAPRLKTIQYYFTDEMVNFFEPGNIDDMARAILELYNDESKRVKQVQMARKFIEKYGWEHHQMDLVNFYNKL